MFPAALFTAARTWKPPAHPTGVRAEEVRCIHTVECYLATEKTSEIMLFAATQMDVETITLSEVSQAEKDKFYMILLIRRI